LFCSGVLAHPWIASEGKSIPSDERDELIWNNDAMRNVRALTIRPSLPAYPDKQTFSASLNMPQRGPTSDIALVILDREGQGS
jgi:hypothetical protein